MSGCYSKPAFVKEVVPKKLRDHTRYSDLDADSHLPKCAGEPAGGPAAGGIPVDAACPAAAGLPGARAVLLAVLAGPSGRVAGPNNYEQEHVRVLSRERMSECRPPRGGLNVRKARGAAAPPPRCSNF